MNITNKFIIGTHVMFYEIEMCNEYIQSIINAINVIHNPENITCDFVFNMSQYFEQIDTSLITEEQLIDKFKDLMTKLESTGCNVRYKIYNNDTQPYTMVNYRRDLNYLNCNDFDLIIWGETDCLLPRETFHSLDELHLYAGQQQIHRYITTFAIRKMWDQSWEILEHPFVHGKPWHSYATEPDLAFNSPYSIRYKMSIDEMYKINDQVDNLDIRIINYPKFDGSCLVISTDLIKAGANIPPGFFGLSSEDTAFMYSCQQIMGNDYKQFVIKNLLKVHNRNHPNKRMYINGSSQQFSHAHIAADKGNWFDIISDLNKENMNRIFFTKNKTILTYNDYESRIKL